MKNTFKASAVLLIFLLTIDTPFALHATGDILRDKLLAHLQSIVDTSDAVVGIAAKDLTSGEEFFINENEIYPQASAIKIHILAELYRQAAEKKFSLSEIRPLPESERVGGSGVLNELGRNTVSMSIRDYAVLMIVLSDNTATNVLIDLVGMDNVNKFLGGLGAQKTRLQRKMMDYKAAAEGRENIGTPKEVLTVLEKMYLGEISGRAASEDMLSIMRKPKPGPIRSGVPATVDVANKEGEIEGIRTDVAIVYLPGKPYAICVMAKYLLHDEDGPRIITDVSSAVYSYFERKANSNEYGRRIPR